MNRKSTGSNQRSDRRVTFSKEDSNVPESQEDNTNLESNNSNLSRRRSFRLDMNASVREVHNDDEAERKQMRDEEDKKKKERDDRAPVLNLSSISSGNTAASFAPSEMSFDRLSSHMQLCMELYNTNRLNRNNVWELKALDYVSQLIQNNDDTDELIRVAGNSFDCLSKIYSLRVDDLHGDVIKLAKNLSSVNMNKSKQEAKHDLNSESDDEDESAPVSKKLKVKEKKSMRKQLASKVRVTIVEDENLLNAPVKKSDKFVGLNQGTVENASSSLNVILPKKRRGYELMIPYVAKKDWLSKDVKTEAKKIKIDLPGFIGYDLSTRHICPPSIRNFAVDQWIDRENDSTLNTTVNQEVTEDTSLEPEGAVGPDCSTLQPYLDPSMDAPASATGLLDLADLDLGDGIEEVAGAAPFEARNPVEEVYTENMQPGLKDLSLNLEYSYRGPPNVSDKYKVTGVWVGPSHWKHKCLRREPQKKTHLKFSVHLPITPKKFKHKKTSRVKPFEFLNLSASEFKNVLRDNMLLKKRTHNKKETRLLDLCTANQFLGVQYGGTELVNCMWEVKISPEDGPPVPVNTEEEHEDEQADAIPEPDSSSEEVEEEQEEEEEEDEEMVREAELQRKINATLDNKDLRWPSDSDDGSDNGFEDSYTETFLPQPDDDSGAGISAAPNEETAAPVEQAAGDDQQTDNGDAKETDHESIPEPDHDNENKEDEGLDEASNAAEFIPFAIKSKRMDMHKLKRKMRELIEESEEKTKIDEDASNTASEPGPSTSSGEPTASTSAEASGGPPQGRPVANLRDIYRQLPSRLNPQMRQNLSVPLAFFSLLHVANDNNLKLEQAADLSNVIIKKRK